MLKDIGNDWQSICEQEFKQEYFIELEKKIDHAYGTEAVFPPEELIFNAFRRTSYKDVKVVLLGQDPYHDDGQAHGLCFSVQRGVKVPPSLRNIFKELQQEMNCELPKHGNLESWADQGVLLLNTVLTVKAHEAASHSKMGWETFTDHIIEALNRREKPIIFILWGNYARSKSKLITGEQHVIIESAHPSPLSANRGFFGSRPFSKVNHILSTWNEQKIDWTIKD